MAKTNNAPTKIYLNYDEGIFFDLDKLVETRALVQANSGGGKSWLLRRILEQSHGKIQQIMIDLEGEFSSLREKFDYVVAGKDEDTPVSIQSAKLLATKINELGFSAIIDLSEMAAHEKPRYVRYFCEGLMAARPKGRNDYTPCLVIIDEAHHFVPQNGQCEAANAVIDLATRGRKRKYCTILATQRLSKLHKDAAAELNNKLIGRTGLDIDMKRASEELGFTKKEQTWSLRMLNSGEFYAFGPAISAEVIKVKIGQVETSHSVARNKTSFKTPAPRAKIKRVLEKLADLPKEAEVEAQTINELRAEIKRLKRTAGINVATPQDIKKLLEPHLTAFRSVEQGYKNTVRNLSKHIDELEKGHSHFIAFMERLNGKRPDDSPGASYAPEKLFGMNLKITSSAPKNGLALKNDKMIVGIDPAAEGGSYAVVAKKEKDGTVSVVDVGWVLTGPEQRIVNAIALLNSFGVSNPTKPAVAFLAGYTVGSGGFNNPCGSLRSKGLIEYRPNQGIALTESGNKVAQIEQRNWTVDEIHQKALDILPGPEQKILKVLIAAYPEPVENTTLADQSGYTPGSGGFNNPKGRLRTLGLIDYPTPGYSRAADILFPV